MTYVAAEARRELLDAVADAADDLGRALALLGAAYELLDEASADALEQELFGPVQSAYGHAKRTATGFAERFALPQPAFAPAGETPAGDWARDLVDDAVACVQDADDALVTLQDSLKPVEVGDAELRAGLARVRETVAAVPSRADRFTRLLGR